MPVIVSNKWAPVRGEMLSPRRLKEMVEAGNWVTYKLPNGNIAVDFEELGGLRSDWLCDRDGKNVRRFDCVEVEVRGDVFYLVTNTSY